MRAVRLAKGLSQQALGEISGLHWTYIGSVERGERNVSIDAMSRIAWALDVPLRELVTGDR